MHLRASLAVRAPRRDPGYRNVLPRRAACNRLNTLRFPDLDPVVFGAPQRSGQSRWLLRVLQRAGRFVPLMGRKFPRTGQ